MRSEHSSPRRTVSCLALLLAVASAAQADVITVTGTNITLLSAPNTTAFDATVGGGSVIRMQSSTGTLGQFDASLGVLTDVNATLSIVTPATLSRAGSAGSAGISYQWLLGGNSRSVSTSTTNLPLTTWSPILMTGSAASLNNFVGLGNIAQNSTNSQVSANRTGPVGSGTSGSITNPFVGAESVAYTYVTHSDASFGLSDLLTIDLGELVSGADADAGFSVFDFGGLGLTSFAVSFLAGDDLFDVAGGNVAAGASGLFNAHFDGEDADVLTSFSGTYRLTFTDDVSGLLRYASNSVGTNSIDLAVRASVAPPAPAAVIAEPNTLALFGLGLVGFGLAGVGFSSRRK